MKGNKFTWTIFSAAIVVVVITGLEGCGRSARYQKNQYEYPDSAQSYYNKAGENLTPSQKIQQLGQPKKKVVVFNFWNDTPTAMRGLGQFAADELRRGLYLTQRMIVPTDIRTHMETSDFIQGDKVRVAQLIREGRRMGVAVLIIGRVKKVVFRQRGDDVGILRQKQTLAATDVEIKIFDVGSGREVMAVGHGGEASSNALVAFEESDLSSQAFRTELVKFSLRNNMVKFAGDVVRSIEKMTWQGLVAKVSGKKVYVNAGRASGLVNGDILKVLTKGDDVFDPESGAYLGRTHGQLKGTLEVLDFIGGDASVGKIHTGGQFQKGDVVRLY